MTAGLDQFAELISREDERIELRERLKRVIPREALGGVPVAELPLDRFLEPASNRQILARLPRNRMIVVAPESAAELRDRGFVYQRLECWRAALKDLAEYLEREPDALDQDEVRAKMVDLTLRCARLN